MRSRWLPSAPGRPGLWVVAGVVLVCLLRLAYLDAGLTRDEGGDTFIALAFHHAGPFAYGSYFLDRPPLLVSLYGLASALGGDTGTRILGLLAACLAVAAIVALAVRLGGRRAAPFAALAGAAMVSSQAAGAALTPAELLATVPSCTSVLLLVAALQRPIPDRRLLFGAGAAACTAVLVKQSFGDALFAGLVGLALATVAARTRRREALSAVLAYAGGVAAVVAALALWAVVAGATPHQLWYALFGFRLDAVGALAGGSPGSRLLHLVDPAVYSGLALGVPIAVAGILLARTSTIVRWTLAAWLVGGVAGIVLSGSDYPPYVIELMPVAAVGVAVACTRRPVLGTAVVLAVAGPALLPTVRASLLDSADAYEQSAMTIGRYVRARAEPHQTAYVLYARANALYYAGLPSPFPYHWALMMRAIPSAEQRLRALLASPGRPTWIVEQDRPNFDALDPGGVTRALLARRYRVVASVCGRPILLARGAPSYPATAGRCGD